MRAIILTAGEGAHFRPLTSTRPKGMSIVAGKPILQHTIEALVTAGIRDVLFVVGYKPERVQTFFGSGSGFGIEASYTVQPNADGTGSALALAARDLPEEDFLVLFGDNHYHPDLLLRIMAAREDVIMASPHASGRRHGLIRARNGKLIAYEFPATGDEGLVNTGLMRFTPTFRRFLIHLPPERSQQLPWVLHEYAQTHEVTVLTADRGWDEANEVWDLLRLNEALLGELTASGSLPAGIHARGTIVIGPSTRIHPGAHLIGPVHIGAGCEVRENAVVGPNVSLRNNVHVGAHSEIRNSIINNNVYIDSQCVVRFSVLDDGVRVGPFTVLSDGDVLARDSGPARLGAVVGVDSELGARVVVEAGSLLGENVRVAAGKVVQALPANAQVT